MSRVGRAIRTTLAAGILVLALALQAAGCQAGACRGDQDCPLMRVCLSGSCELSCAFADTPCPTGRICFDGRCQVACLRTEECGSGALCSSDFICVPSATSNQDESSTD
jgi:hypothetical protein